MIAVTLTLLPIAALKFDVVIINSILVMTHKWKHALRITHMQVPSEGPKKNTP
jgi:hypothetical protein